MAIGTSGNDTLSTSFDGEVLFGFQGDDTLTSTHNLTSLFCDPGDDTLDSTLTFNDPNAFDYVAQQSQSGHEGGDGLTISANVTVNSNASATFAQ